MVILLSTSATPYICHATSILTIVWRADKQLTPSIKGRVTVGENTIKYSHLGLDIKNV